LRKILVANRGEIAVRIIRACRDMGLASVAVYSDCDRAARHVRMADEAVAIGGSPPRDSYLRIDRLVHAARVTGADAVHPGYGFVSENADFAEACVGAGLTFIGPTPSAIRLLGDKTAARRTANASGVSVVPGTAEPFPLDAPLDDIAHAAAEVGYPVLVKAVAGGGGKGMRVVSHPDALVNAVMAARSEASAAFGEGGIDLARHLARPRPVEVQVLGDHHGSVVAFVERECSIQRRHQKVIEESPSLAITNTVRAELTAAAVAVASRAGYTNAGTAEFLLDEHGRFYFLEMNTRLQVEHPVTELVTGVDLVQWQIRIARGEALSLDPITLLTPRAHAIECRIYAEDADQGFLPAPGRISELRAPEGPGVRVDSAAEAGSEVPTYYDPLLAKLCAWGADRREAVARLSRALDEYDIRGITTGIPFLRWLIRRPEFVDARFHTAFLDDLLQERAGESFEHLDSSFEEVAALPAAVRADAGMGSELVRPARALVEGLLPPPASGWRAQARLGGLRG
jgi:acetyl-CoA carboxylase biotin carboxylase subunit